MKRKLAPDAARLEQGAGAGPRRLAGHARCPGDLAAGGQPAPDRAHHPRLPDGISYPSIEGIGIPGSNPQEAPLKAGEFILGYPDETGNLPPMPQPEVLGRNGTYVARAQAPHQGGGLAPVPAREQPPAPRRRRCWRRRWSGAGRAGRRWPSSPEHDDPELGADPHRNNDFLYRENDDRGFKCPAGAHIRRVNPRDADIIGVRTAAPHHPPRHHLRPAAARGRAGGRRGRPGPGRSLHRGPPGPAVRVHQGRVGQRRQLHRLPRREGPGGRAPRRNRQRHHPGEARSGAACRTCPASWSPAAASTASCRACAPCAGSRSWRTEGSPTP